MKKFDRTKLPQREDIRCPLHDLPVKIEMVDIRYGLCEAVIKKMIVGKCPVEGCKQWCEITPGYFGEPAMVMWP